MNIDVIIYTSSAVLMMLIYLGFLVWGIKTKQFKDNEHLKYKPLEEDEEERLTE
ncbi:MAG: cbb3-type cytochrome oxidase assembly protein CcoS [Candidatus Bathyarchaeota archaeon]